MNFQRGKFREEPEINLIPMIDVLLVILIFLMVTTTYSKFADLKINLPEAEVEQTKSAPNTLDVAVDADGNYVVNLTVVPFSDIAGFSQVLKGAAGDRQDPTVVISADAQASHQSVINILSAAQLAGFSHISFTAEAKRK
ncbi:MAG: biopolymer transporter ExbD [Pseudomonadota bacterium]|nr:biopolymer transporter ExbD [Pseudomonadota bacterium]